MLAVFRSKRMFVLFALGYAGGLPLYLTGQTLQSWMTDAHVDLKQIAAFNAVGLAYTFKFLWAPLLDRFRLPLLGRRRGWLFALCALLVPAIAGMGAIDPVEQPVLLAIAAVVVAFLSASQDVVIDAYKADILAPEERAAGAAAYVLGYRVAMVVSGFLALVLADHLAWRAVYLVMAGLQAIGIIGVWLAAEPPAPTDAPRTLAESVWHPFADFFQRLGARSAVLVLGFAALYRFGDSFMQALQRPFLQEQFTKTNIAVVSQIVGLAGTFIGGIAAGAFAARFSLRRTLIVFAVLAALTNLMYTWLALAPGSEPIFWSATFIDHATNALAIAAFQAVLMGACSPAFSATQFALLTSLSSVGQRVFGPFAGDVVGSLGWAGFFAATAAMAIPGLVLAWRVARDPRLI